jgi:hypothetical protein
MIRGRYKGYSQYQSFGLFPSDIAFRVDIGYPIGYRAVIDFVGIHEFYVPKSPEIFIYK